MLMGLYCMLKPNSKFSSSKRQGYHESTKSGAFFGLKEKGVSEREEKEKNKEHKGNAGGWEKV